MTPSFSERSFNAGPVRAERRDLHRVIGHLFGLAATTLAIASALAFVTLNQAPLPEETIVLAAAALTGSLIGQAVPNSSH